MDERVTPDPDPGRGSPTGSLAGTIEDQRSPAAVLPTVVAVVVTHNPGPWFEEALASLVGQEYPNLSILVFDTGSDVDPTHRIAEVAPRAYVRRLQRNQGPGAAVNAAMSMVEGAPFFLICHDDVALAPNVVRLLVEEAYRSNAGIVGPKLVRWDQPDALLAVGMGADRFGAPFPLCERGELDQEQHDGVRDVFFVPGSCFLIRSDLLRALGGFDEAMSFHGEDTDLCWRAHLAGARVLVAPSARVRHVEALGERRRDDRRKLQTRHRLRMVMTNYGWFYLLGELVQQAVLTIVEVVFAAVTGRVRHVRDLLGAWAWNLRRLGSVLAKRRRVKAARQVTDLEVRRLQVRGSARLTGFLRGQVGSGDVNATLGDSLRQWLTRRGAGAHPHNAIAGLLVAFVVLFGSRHLLTRTLPAVGEFGLFPDHARDLLRGAWSDWSTSGVGANAQPPTGLGLFGLVGLLFFGGTGLARLVLIMGTIPAGLLGAWKLGSFAPHSRGKAAALLAYAANPLPYNALTNGRWAALACYAVLPWTVASLARAGGIEPFAGPAAGTRGQFVRSTAAIGVFVAALVALYPPAAGVVGLTAVGLLVGSLLAGDRAGSLRLAASGVTGIALGLALHAPWLIAAWNAQDPDVRTVGSVGGADQLALHDLLRFHTGRIGGSLIGWGLLVAGIAGLAIGRSWRLSWAVRGWSLYVVPMAVIVAVQSGLLDMALPPAEVLLAPACVGIAVAAAAGMAAFDVDLSAYRFGWRQLAGVGAAAGLVAALAPLVAGSINGRWQMPRGGYNRVLSFVADEQTSTGPFRVLWLGADDVLPVSGWPVGDAETNYATSYGYPTVRGAVWTGPETDATEIIPQALERARNGGTNRLGQQLAPAAIRYVVVVDRLAPTPFESLEHPAAAWIDATMSSQLDLAEIDLNAAMRVYRNTAWLPTVAVVAADVQTADQLPLPDTLEPASPALSADGFQRYDGNLDDTAVDGAGVVHLAEAFDPDWKLTVDGVSAPASVGFGFANRYEVANAGPATLRYQTSPMTAIIWFAQLIAWLLVVIVALRGLSLGKARRRDLPVAAPATPDASTPPILAPMQARASDDVGATDEAASVDEARVEPAAVGDVTDTMADPPSDDPSGDDPSGDDPSGDDPSGDDGRLDEVPVDAAPLDHGFADDGADELDWDGGP